jgi:hypothetical protein
MGAQPPKNQLSLAFGADHRGATPTAVTPGPDASIARPRPASPGRDERGMAAMVLHENLIPLANSSPAELLRNSEA